MSNDRNMILKVQRLAEQQGFATRRTRDGLMVLGKNREDGSVLIHGSDSDVRAWRNARSRLRRLGLTL